MTQKKLFYAEDNINRKNAIIRWFLEDVNKRNLIDSLQMYVDYGNISFLEDVIREHPESAFMYIIEYGMTSDFARRLTSYFNIVPTERDIIKPDIEKPKRKERVYGYVNNKRIKIKQYTPITIKGNVIVRARDKYGRFIKIPK